MHTRMTRGRALALLALGVPAATGCRPAVPKTQQATEVVQRFFTALPEGDCATLSPLLVSGPTERPCAEVVAELNAHAVRLLEVLSAQEDGRSPDAVLVRARLAQAGAPRPEPSLLRVERQGKNWRLRP